MTSVLLPGQYYHVYNRGNNRENIFREERNYQYFLKLYAYHVEPVAETYAYCLLRNHFHFLVKIRDTPSLADTAAKSRKPSQCFSNLFNAYARAFNREYQRTGALFQRPFGRILVTSHTYFVQLITYIHRNPHKHGFVSDFREWPYSSYHALVSTKPTRLQREVVLNWFGNVQHFELVHQHSELPLEIEALAPDDFD
jgi:REP element-mobilizing transposase RayT